MAENIVVYFNRARSEDLQSALSEIAARGRDGKTWLYPPGKDHDVSVYEYADIFREFDNSYVARVNRALGGAPASVLCVEMRGSKGKNAVDSAVSLVVALLRRFEGAADDLWAEPHIWSLVEIEQGTEKDGKTFLACYRDRLTDE